MLRCTLVVKLLLQLCLLLLPLIGLGNIFNHLILNEQNQSHCKTPHLLQHLNFDLFCLQVSEYSIDTIEQTVGY